MLFYEYVANHLTKADIEDLGTAIGLREFAGQKTTGMARELYDYARRRRRMTQLFNEIGHRFPELDLSPYLYELVVTYFDEDRATALWKRLGQDGQRVYGWDYDDYLKRTASEELQADLAAEGRLSKLVEALHEIQPNLALEFLAGVGAPEAQAAAPPGNEDEGTGRGATGSESGTDWEETPAEESGPAGPVQLRLDVAVPEQVELDRSFQVAVTVRTPDSPKLAEADLGHVESGDVQINWPDARRPVRLRVQISAPDCEIHGPESHSFSLYTNRNSPVFYFHLTPKVSGSVGIVVTLFQEEDWIGSARVHTSAQEKVAGRVQMNIASYQIDQDDSHRPPPEAEYEDFDIHIGDRRAADGKYPVQVLGTPLGVRMVNDPELVEFPLKDPYFLLPIQHLRGLVARLDDTKTLGDGLRKLLFPGRVWHLFQRSLDKVKRERKGIRIRLQIDDNAPELGIFPWEYAYYPEDNYFLALRRATPIVRYIERSYEAQPLHTDRPRVLVAIASPKHDDLAELDTGDEIAQIEQALNNLGYPLDWELLTGATFDRLQQKLKDGYDILHYIGHGLRDDDTQAGLLAFEDDQGLLDPISHERLGVLLRDTGVKLVVLAACQSADYGEGDIFKGVAQSLVQAEIPAVIAMQFVVEYQVAREYTRQLYYYLAAGLPLDRALTEARISAYERRGDYVSWGIPVLFMQAADGQIWLPPKNPVVQQRAATSRPLAAVEPGPAEVEARQGATMISQYQYFYGNVEKVQMGDEIIQGDKVGGDKVEGDKIGRDVVNISGVSGGVVSVGGDAAGGDLYRAGRDMQINPADPASREEFKQLLQTIVAQFEAIRDQLPAGDADDAANDLADAQQLAAAAEPDGRRLIRKLSSVAQIITAAGGAVAAAGQLAPVLQQAVKIAQSLFGG
jgi:hypothetical protein